MAAEETKDFSQARVMAFRFLKIRERSVKELRDKLALKAVSSEVIERTIAYLAEKKFLNDEQFARNWIRYRQARPFGPQRIKMELRQKGISEEIIVQQMQLAFENQGQEDAVFDLASRRAKRYANDDPIKRKKKVFDFLSRRGFGLEIIKKAVKDI
ncbi:MAG: regulatory protein RecX [Candidatus Omnitrophica bacterium]|nr:regulatory protein RecX [Candidatus Omnitrophota bacterium]